MAKEEKAQGQAWRKGGSELKKRKRRRKNGRKFRRKLREQEKAQVRLEKRRK